MTMKFNEDISTHSLYDPQLCLNVVASEGPNRNKTYSIRGNHFRFGLVFIKKINQTGFFKKKQNRFKPTSFGSVILEQKPVQTDRFRFDSVFSFFSGFGSVQFFQFQTYKIKTEPN